MISAGELKPAEVVSGVQSLGCDQMGFADPVPLHCQENVSDSFDRHSQGMSDAQKKMFAKLPFTMAGISGYADCMSIVGGSDAADANAACFAATVQNGSYNGAARMISMPGAAPRTWDDFLADMAQEVKEGTLDEGAMTGVIAGTVPMPDVLKNYLDSIRGAHPVIATEAERLFREALMQVDPTKMMLAAEPIANDVKAWAEGSVALFEAEPDADKQNMLKAQFVSAYVHKVDSSNYQTTIDDLTLFSKIIEKPESVGLAAGAKLYEDLKAVAEIRRIFTEALAILRKKGGETNGAGVVALATKSAEAIKGLNAAANLAEAIGKKKVGDVTIDASSKIATQVILADRETGDVEGVPARLVDALGARDEALKLAALKALWADVVKAAGDRMNDAFKEKLVDSLIGSLSGRSAKEIALMYVMEVKDDGSVILVMAPKELGGRVLMRAANIAVYQKLKNDFVKAIKAQPEKYSGAEPEKVTARRELARQISDAATHIILHDSDGKVRSSLTEGLDQFLDSPFSGFDGSGNVESYPYVNEASNEAILTPDGRLTFTVAGEGQLGGVFGKETNDSFQGYLYAGAGLNYKASEHWTLGLEGSILAGHFVDPLHRPDDNAFYLGEGGATIARVNTLSGNIGMEYDPFALRLNGGLISKKMPRVDSPIEATTLWYADPAMLGSSKSFGFQLAPTLSLLNERLTLGAGLLFATAKGGLNFTNITPADEDGDGYADNEEHVGIKNGHDLGFSFRIDGVPVADRWRIGADVIYHHGFGEASDPASLDGNWALTTDVSTSVCLTDGGFGDCHRLDFGFRFNRFVNDDNIDFDQYAGGALYTGPWYDGALLAMRGNIWLTGMGKSGDLTPGADLVGSNPVPGGGLNDWGQGLGSMGSETPTLGLGNRAVEMAIGPEFIFNPWKKWTIVLQPVGALIFTGQDEFNTEGAGLLNIKLQKTP